MKEKSENGKRIRGTLVAVLFSLAMGMGGGSLAGATSGVAAIGSIVGISVGVLVFVIVFVIIDSVLSTNNITDPLLAVVVPSAASIGAVLGVYAVYQESVGRRRRD